MKQFKVYGSGCPKCRQTAEMIKAEADRLGVEISLEKVFDPAAAVAAGIMSMPGVMLDGKIIHAGGLPKTEAVRSWLSD